MLVTYFSGQDFQEEKRQRISDQDSSVNGHQDPSVNGHQDSSVNGHQDSSVRGHSQQEELASSPHLTETFTSGFIHGEPMYHESTGPCHKEPSSNDSSHLEALYPATDSGTSIPELSSPQVPRCDPDNQGNCFSLTFIYTWRQH